MKPGHKFLFGAVLIVGSVGLLMFQGVKETGVYFLTPTELATKASADPTFHNVGVKMGARVVPGSVVRDAATQTVDFKVTDGKGIGVVVELSNGATTWFFDDEITAA